MNGMGSRLGPPEPRVVWAAAGRHERGCARHERHELAHRAPVAAAGRNRPEGSHDCHDQRAPPAVDTHRRTSRFVAYHVLTGSHRSGTVMRISDTYHYSSEVSFHWRLPLDVGASARVVGW